LIPVVFKKYYDFLLAQEGTHVRKRKQVLLDVNIHSQPAERIKIIYSHRLKRSDNVTYLPHYLHISTLFLKSVPRGKKS
jgi:hypothetical protein